ncbi:uncharacterized protein LOC108477804 [Gossypium arboreum]|uniref:RING-type domain-containing protein n=1 Tax=Gossypium arboreum TaxID=29729 RepID=A0ABR0MLK9_GOSAR|nr:uncharacterized protein LOC108477804 [Gossypium arboreum]KAK5774891.1 hypothetical protein PVK06_042753 [Gossypium arboreum]
MASSQLEIVPSSPFGCVLRDHNRKERCRDSNVSSVQTVFDKNFNDLVRDHINGCISLSSPKSPQNHNNVASWVTDEQGNANANPNANANRHNVPSFSNKNHHNKKNGDPSASPINPKQSPVLDRWVTRQSQDLAVSTIDKQVNEAAEQVLAPSHSNPVSPPPPPPPVASSSTTKNAQTRSENASVTHNLAASSLVQIWEARLNRSNSINSYQNQSMDSNTSRTSSGVSSNENNASPMEESSTSEPFEEKMENRTNNVDSLIELESFSDRTAAGEAASSSSSACSKTFDAGEIERVRIVDIIKKLKNCREDANDHEHTGSHSQCKEPKHCSKPNESLRRCFSLVINSPLIRGRQAFQDFLIRIERDKKRELESLVKRQAVSKFPQRGRVQSMLRLKSLQRCLTIQDKCRPQLNRSQGSTIMHLREKFSTGAEQGMTAQNVSATPRYICKDKSSTCKPPQREDTHCQKGQQSSSPLDSLTTNKYEDIKEKAKPPSDAVQQKTSLEAKSPESPKISKETKPLEAPSENEVAKKEELSSQQQLILGSQETAETVTQNEVAKAEQEKDQHQLILDSQENMETTTTTSVVSSIENEIVEEEDIGDQQHICVDPQSQDIVDNTSTSCINDGNENEVTEEEEDHYQQYFDETDDYDWFSNISRPRSYWEGLRQAWYDEVLNATSNNEEIRQLLERGRVSTLLGSDFRDTMDRLMTSRVQIQADGAESQQEVDDKEGIICRGRVSTLFDSDFLEKMNRLMTSRVQMQADVAESQQEVEDKEGMVQRVSYEEEEEEEEEYDDEEERSLSSRQCQEVNNYFNNSSPSIQMPSPSAMMTRSWSFQDDNETSNDERGASLFSPPPQPSQAEGYQDARQSASSINRPSLEMELICDLRGHIEQLHSEISELRKSVMTCMDMQMKWQHYSLNREVHSVEGEGKNSADRTPWKRSCCICYEMQVDSLLYRCGHMCTCLKCGNELQWRSGKCPICRAPILDVVPAK